MSRQTTQRVLFLLEFVNQINIFIRLAERRYSKIKNLEMADRKSIPAIKSVDNDKLGVMLRLHN